MPEEKRAKKNHPRMAKNEDFHRKQGGYQFYNATIMIGGIYK